MLTPDLVHARVYGERLLLTPFTEDRRARARALAEQVLGVLCEYEGEEREEVLHALRLVAAPPKDQKLLRALVKLALDEATFDEPDEKAAPALRREVFAEAFRLRRAALDRNDFSRAGVFQAVATSFQFPRERLERELYSDLCGRHRLRAAPTLGPVTLVNRVEEGEPQAILLRASDVTIALPKGAETGLRQLFQRIKFLQLLYTIRRDPDGAFTIAIDGPLSMLESGTRYGLRLSMLLPVLGHMSGWTLAANVRWREKRVVFNHAPPAEPGGERAEAHPEPLADFLEGFRALGSAYAVRRATEILEAKGLGVVVPDLVFERGEEKTYFEVMGYWSREAVFRRVEMVEKGLRERVIFAVSERLRVRAEVLPEGARGMLYVYKGIMSPRKVLSLLEGCA